ncbi:hypothetical protein HNP84_003820 [Thermocatellispora tengchongensis]|uniref:Uncharacterized protein n=1 Tax=Thermocatellispora tengchongensis TaxID=1073253 RepID=A0A840NYW2_9ACTN|nr:hypothetical protein [Thermocatellispora tengchongensis]MBB5134094.1 hypothetical protein [Thermocatellispora tengchongensis]
MSQLFAAIFIVLMGVLACASYELCLGSLSRPRKPAADEPQAAAGEDVTVIRQP